MLISPVTTEDVQRMIGTCNVFLKRLSFFLNVFPQKSLVHKSLVKKSISHGSLKFGKTVSRRRTTIDSHTTEKKTSITLYAKAKCVKKKV